MPDNDCKKCIYLCGLYAHAVADKLIKVGHVIERPNTRHVNEETGVESIVLEYTKEKYDVS